MTTKQLKDLREQMQEDLRTVLDGMPAAAIDAACDVVVKRLRVTKPKKGRTHIISFKDPDTVDTCLRDVSEDEAKQVKAVLNPYIEYGEYAHIEVDIDNKTVALLKVPRDSR